MAGPLRVLVATNMYPTPDRPALGTFVAEQVESLRRRGHRLDVLFIDGPGGRANYARGVGELRRRVSAGDYQLVHAHYVFTALIALAQRRLPVLVTHHGIEAQQGWTAPLCRLSSRLAARTIATSPAVAATLGTPGAVVIPCGVDTELFRPLPRAAACAALGLDPDRRYVLFVGRADPEKRLPLIREAAARVAAGEAGVDLLLVHGEPRERVPLYMNAADVLVLASVAEGSPVVVREAMACNLPVVSTDVGDVRDLFGDLEGHYLVEGEADPLADGLRRALAAGGRTQGRQRILPWSLDAVAARVEQEYRAVAGTRGTAE
jgi:glycosyltransferase involved in cell wall biosynthesis